MSNKTYIPPDIQRLMKLGREGKLFAVEIMYDVRVPFHETKIEWKRNMEAVELMKFREALFKYGFSMPVKGKTGHWRLILPMDIVTVDIYRQEAYIADAFRMAYAEPDKDQPA